MIVLDKAGAHKNLKTNVEDLFRFGRQHNVQVIYHAHYVKDILPAVKINCLNLYITINNPDNFFETVIKPIQLKISNAPTLCYINYNNTAIGWIMVQ